MLTFSATGRRFSLGTAGALRRWERFGLLPAVEASGGVEPAQEIVIQRRQIFALGNERTTRIDIDSIRG